MKHRRRGSIHRWLVCALALGMGSVTADPTTPAVAGGRAASPFVPEKHALSADDPSVGNRADVKSLHDRLDAFFGGATGRYLTDQVIDIDTARPGWDTHERPVYDQFVAVFGGPAEFEATLPNGVRMVVRSRSTYHAAVFVDEAGALVSAALTFDLCPPGGVDQTVAEGRVLHSACLWPFSAVLFHRGDAPDAVVVDALKDYVYRLASDVDRADAMRMTRDGHVRIKIFDRRL